MLEGKKWGLGAWKPKVGKLAAAAGEHLRTRGGSIIPLVVIVIIAGLVLLFV